MRYMLGKTERLDTNPTGQRCSCIHHPALSPRSSCPTRVQTLWPQWLMVIPALAPTLNRSLCLVGALHYYMYLDRPPEFGRIRSWFLSPLRKVLTKTSRLPLSPLGSGIVILCYELSDQEAHTLHQVKAHVVMAFCL